MRVLTDWLLTPERAAVHVPTATAVVADLHLGYDTVRCQIGEAIPEFGLDDVVAGLRTLIERHRIRRLVVAGDFLEDGRCGGPVAELLGWLHSEGVEVAGVVPGNHDRTLVQFAGIMPLFPEGISVGDWRVVHGDRCLPPGKIIQGHLHPYFCWNDEITAPCYLVGRHRLILPALSQDAVGVNVLRDSRWRSYHCHVIAANQVLDFGEIGRLRKCER